MFASDGLRFAGEQPNGNFRPDARANAKSGDFCRHLRPGRAVLGPPVEWAVKDSALSLGDVPDVCEPVWNLSRGAPDSRPTTGVPSTLTVYFPMQRDLINAVGFTVLVCLATALALALWA